LRKLNHYGETASAVLFGEAGSRPSMIDSTGIGAIEELPALLVVLIAISLFSVSFAQATTSWNENQDFIVMQKNCQKFSEMVRSSDILCGENSAGIYDFHRVQNISSNFFNQYNSSLLGFEYLITIQPFNNSSFYSVQSSMMPEASEIVTFHTCVNIILNDRITGARLIVSIWEAPQ